MQRDLGAMILYREPFMTGWAYKVLTHPDLRLPLVSGQGKRVHILVVYLGLCLYKSLLQKNFSVESCNEYNRRYKRFW